VVAHALCSRCREMCSLIHEVSPLAPTHPNTRKPAGRTILQ
jgi:hypothetical protein